MALQFLLERRTEAQGGEPQQGMIRQANLILAAVNVSAPAYTDGPPRNQFEALMNAFDITSERLTIEELEGRMW